ncbi:MAG: UDP-N-acetylmuramate--L-alanine ligase [Wolbachia endosymbiont of Tyrophagus putrescentiae]|nr:UDP-N-acetylmuramate--L-alanine ligase [Wolbachia endosymbiont of Tyrophagus putrescentiae]MDN5248982.1 UDP-N-acetylmuramate--L-alanine ligase [Alphaproteobacteria bacterium]
MNNTKIVHVIGIGGIGMSAIAEILYNLGYRVQGSDEHSNGNVERLRKFGIEVYIGHSASNIVHAQTVIYSSAIKPDNVELVAARENNKVVMHRSEILAELAEDKYTIAVSGSSGKTTTTAIVASIFDYSNVDAIVIAGGVLNSYQSNAKFGRGNIFLLEADESDGTALKIPADVAVVTSINDDHIDYYGTSDNIKCAFQQFISKADYAVLPVSVDINYNAITFGFADANIIATNIMQYADSIGFDVLVNYSEKKYSLNNVLLSNAVGIHKVSNALAAISVAVKLEISEEGIRKGLSEFKGVKRRFTTVANINGIRLIEDYAHHPTEIHATLTATRSISEGKVIGVIELLRFARIRNFFDEFIKVFKMFDYIILTPVHPPEDECIPGCSLEDIQEALVDSHVEIMNDSLLITRFINDFTDPGDMVLFIGAGGNIARLAQETAKLMAGDK